MTNTERDNKQNKPSESESRDRVDEESESGSANKLPAMPAGDDESPLGDTDQHAD